MKERIAIIEGYRTPFAKAGGELKGFEADELGTIIVKEVMERSVLEYDDIDEIIMGNVAQPAHSANIARVIAIKAGFNQTIPAYTVHRNCASGMESISTAANKILADQASIVLAGGTESMSNIPFLLQPQMKEYVEGLSRQKTTLKKLKYLSKFPFNQLKPVIGVVQGLTDPTCGLIMGMTAENLAKEFSVTRDQQDQYALFSHQKAAKAAEHGHFNHEIIPLSLKPKYDSMLDHDAGPRKDQSLEALQKLRPYFDRKNGTVTVGNACPLTDGAAAVIVMKESEAKKRGIKPLGYLHSYAYAGLEPHRMGLGPVYASAKVLNNSPYSMKDIDIVEMNEAFSVQIIANLKAFASKEFANKHLNQSEAVGEIDPKFLNPNGGAVALGHPVGTSGTRMVITCLKELHRQKKHRGLATLCVGGGQGGAFILETE